MNSVDLHCHICPKQPDFSDISHLLTHVGSKGHLSNYFKAQVRSNQDASVRHQLNVYEQWYTEHEIEKLLSQRMILKDSKKANGVAKATTREKSTPLKPTKSLQTTNKKVAPTKKRELAVRAATEPVIDPQLSQPTTSTSQSVDPRHPPSPLSSPGFDITSIHHGPYPPMRSFSTSNRKAAAVKSIEQQRLEQSAYTDPATDTNMVRYDTETGEEPSARQSVEPLYPEPPDMQAMDAPLDAQEIPAASRRIGRGRPRNAKIHQDTCETEEIATPRTPELKGIYYPGMSLFDSASAAAQKKRNQRKNESILAQIQQESLEVECNEYIYWPDGSLKMCRFITGDVQSSPMKEDTPPPPPPKRRRGRKAKAANGNARQGKSKKENQPPTTPDELVFGYLTHHHDEPVMPYAVHGSLSPDFRNAIVHHKQEEAEEWFLNMDEPTLRNRQTFSILSDPAMPSPDMAASPVKLQPNPLNPSMSPHTSHVTDDTCTTWLMTDGRLHDSKQNMHAASERFSSSFSSHQVEPARRSILGQLHPLAINRPINERSHNHGSNRHGFDAGSSAQDFLSHEVNMQGKPILAHSRSAYPKFGPAKENFPLSLTGAMKNDGSHPAEVQKYFMVTNNQGAQTFPTLPPEMAFAGMKTPPVYRASLNPLNPIAHLRQSLPYSSNYTPFRSEYAGTLSGYRSFSEDVREDSDMRKEYG
ncbi:MAG: hypothetical protein Q9169_003715 [Polycauliona sp. 2 TL-2023]